MKVLETQERVGFNFIYCIKIKIIFLKPKTIFFLKHIKHKTMF